MPPFWKKEKTLTARYVQLYATQRKTGKKHRSRKSNDWDHSRNVTSSIRRKAASHFQQLSYFSTRRKRLWKNVYLHYYWQWAYPKVCVNLQTVKLDWLLMSIVLLCILAMGLYTLIEALENFHKSWHIFTKIVKFW